MNTRIGSIFAAMSTVALFAGCIDDPSTPGEPVVESTTRAQATEASLASRHADAFVANRPAVLHASPHDAFAQTRVESSGKLSYVAYERTYLGLPVIGGDFVLVIDDAGQLAYQSVAPQRPIDITSITPTLSQATAESIAARQLVTVTGVESTQLVVNALGDTARLAW